MSSKTERTLNRALRAAIVVTGLVGTTALTGCDEVRERLVEGTGAHGEVCVGWSMQGSPRRCCESRGGYYSGGFFTGSCMPAGVMGPFVPPSLVG